MIGGTEIVRVSVRRNNTKIELQACTALRSGSTVHLKNVERGKTGKLQTVNYNNGKQEVSDPNGEKSCAQPLEVPI